MNFSNLENPKRVVLTGGPGAGKTTAAAILRREIGDHVVVVPEAATMIFTGGFPRYREIEALKATQSAIYHLQKNIEDVQSRAFPERVLLCDRGTLDSAAYWPNGTEDFFNFMGTSFEEELTRYDAVIFFESSAAAQLSVIECGNPSRNETIEEAMAIDKKLQSIWSQHPNYHFIGHEKSFIKKLNKAFDTIRETIKL